MWAESAVEAAATAAGREQRVMTADSDWVDPGAAHGAVVVPVGRLDSEGWRSTARVGRDASLAGTLVMAGTEVVKSVGWVSPETLASMPYTMVVATGLATVVVRLVWRWLGNYVT